MDYIKDKSSWEIVQDIKDQGNFNKCVSKATENVVIKINSKRDHGEKTAVRAGGETLNVSSKW